jgi:DNA polymerase I-like protein with 3'-5' exonuclease and polymerase domains
MWYRLRSLEARSFIVNTVHDSIVAEIHPDEQDMWRSVIQAAFTTDVYLYLEKVYNFKFSLPLGVGYNIGERWGDGEEKLYEKDPRHIQTVNL